MHDIGKVAISESIVQKPGPLSPDEWAFMRKHTIIGERVLSGVRATESVAAIVRSSHERWEGGGYPDGLAGEDIPIEARIVAVADAFCAMTDDPHTGPRARSKTRSPSCGAAPAPSSTQPSSRRSYPRSSAPRLPPRVAERHRPSFRHTRSDFVRVP